MRLMNTVNYFLIAEDVLKSDDGSVSFIRVFNKIIVKELPLVHPKITIAFGLYPAEHHENDGVVKIKLEVLSPEQEVLAELTATAKRTEPKPENGPDKEIASFIDISKDIKLDEYGVYTYRLWCNDELLAENRFEVVPPQKAGAKK
jgi:hypothetical protein